MTRVGLVAVGVAFAGCGGNVRGSGNNGPNGGTDTSGGSAAVEPPPGWSTRDDTPTARSGAAAVIDEARDRLIVYGGSDNDTWAFPLSGPNAKHWQHIVATGSYPPIETQGLGPSQSALYDPFGQRLLLVLDVAQPDVSQKYVDQPQLWQLSLSGTPVWQQLNPDGAFPGQEIAYAKVALDRTNKRAVFVGGGSNSGVWALSLDGAPAWTRLGSVPPVDLSSGLFALALGGSLAVDEQRGRLLLVEGYDRTPNIWAMDWATAAWSKLGQLNCGADYGATIVFDQPGDRFLGTSRDCGVTTFSLATGVTHSVPDNPLDLDGPGIAVDEKRQRVLYFSGSNENSVRALALVDFKVSEAMPNTRSAVTPGGFAVWDAGRQAVVSFGDDPGTTASHRLGAHDSWLQLAVGAAAPGGYSAGIADPNDGSIIAFAGRATAEADTVYRLAAGAGAHWQVVATNPGPAPRTGAVVVYDSTRRRMLIHGGSHGSSYPPGTVFGDAWALSLDGTPAWSLLDVRGDSPGARSGEGAIYDPVGQRMIVYGGNNDSAQHLLPSLHSLALDDSLEWSVLNPSGTPPPVSENFSVVYDPIGQRMLMANVADGRVFALDLAALAWHEFCLAGLIPGMQYSDLRPALNAVVVPDGLFVAANGGAYRFNLSTPYCD
ncbi:MAG: hypothetical protein ABI488_15660 [Polyangiaceae bacterium]